MSVLEGFAHCTLLHEGGEAFIYRVDVGEKSYVLKWYAKDAELDTAVVDAVRSARIPGLYHIVEAGEKAGRGYLVYDFIEGIAAKELGRFPIPVALSLVRNLVKSLAELFKVGIHHGDLNPANVIVGPEGSATLIDCGIVGPGALAYAAPERIQGKSADASSDIYSLGLLLYRLVAGEDLLVCDSYEGFAQAASEIDALDLTAILYGKGIAADVLASLAPVWKASLRANPSNRAEDLDEFDEILEIAFDSLSGGPVAWETTREAFVKSLSGKIGTNCNEGLPECSLPPEFVVIKPTGTKKIVVFAIIFVLILLMTALFLALSSRAPSVDETGAKILLKSRSIDGAVEIRSDSAEDSVRVSEEILEELPVPERNE